MQAALRLTPEFSRPSVLPSWAHRTPASDAQRQAGVQRVNDVLARMEKAKAEHDAAMADAAPWRATTGDCL